MQDTRFVTPVKSARGLGAARSGTVHHIRQRVSALALIVLVPWFMLSVMQAVNGGYAAAISWIGNPVNGGLLLLTAAAAIFHMRLGMQAVIEDYIGRSGTRAALLILNTFAAAALFAAIALAVVRLWTAS